MNYRELGTFAELKRVQKLKKNVTKKCPLRKSKSTSINTPNKTSTSATSVTILGNMRRNRSSLICTGDALATAFKTFTTSVKTVVYRKLNKLTDNLTTSALRTF